ncbi:MAG: cytochrome c biogenesis CcdA family protein [Candidatus Woesearchaeota archaeon]
MSEISLIIAFVAGLVSFFSPCVLPLLPGYLAYLSGVSINEKANLKIFKHSLMYVLGFSLVFALLGVLLQTLLYAVSDVVMLWLARIGGVIIIVFGLHMLNIVPISFLSKQKTIAFKKKKGTSYYTSFIFGSAFALGWTPCFGAILGSIVALSASYPTMGFFFLLAYTLGLGIPFLLIGLVPSENFVKAIKPYLKYFNVFVGVLLLLLGVLVFTQNLNVISF